MPNFGCGRVTTLWAPLRQRRCHSSLRSAERRAWRIRQATSKADASRLPKRCATIVRMLAAVDLPQEIQDLHASAMGVAFEVFAAVERWATPRDFRAEVDLLHATEP